MSSKKYEDSDHMHNTGLLIIFPNCVFHILGEVDAKLKGSAKRFTYVMSLHPLYTTLEGPRPHNLNFTILWYGLQMSIKDPHNFMVKPLGLNVT